jgi:hypothetical protein
MVNLKPRPLYPRGQSPRNQLDRRLSGPQNRSGLRGEDKILAPTGTRTPTSRSSRCSEPSTVLHLFSELNPVGRVIYPRNGPTENTACIISFYCCVTSPRTRKLRALHSNGCCFQLPLSNWSVCLSTKTDIQ